VATPGVMIAFAGLLFVAATAAVAGISSLFRGRDPAVRRLRGDPTGPSPSVQLRSLAAQAPGDDAGSRLRQQLVWAGLRGQRAPRIFVAAKAALAVAALGAVVLVNALRVQPLRMALPIALWATAAGFFLPNLWLRARVADRQRQLSRALPDTLDLLVACVEAGLGLDAALQRVADETALAFPLLSSELRLAFLEVKAGIPRIEALRRLADRTGSQELRSLAATLAQTEMFGTSIGSALRVQAEGIRVRRMQLAEERAGYVAVKMTFPLVVCILPSLFSVLLGPAIVNIAEKLLPMLGGQR